MSCPIHVVEFFDLRLIQGRGTSVKNRSMVITDLQYEPEITHIVPLYDDFDIIRTRFFFALVLARFHLRSFTALRRCAALRADWCTFGFLVFKLGPTSGTWTRTSPTRPPPWRRLSRRDSTSRCTTSRSRSARRPRYDHNFVIVFDHFSRISQPPHTPHGLFFFVAMLIGC